MAANVETAVYFKEPAWHGLGTVVSEAPTSADALRLAGLDWDVLAEPIFLRNGDEIPEKMANVRQSDDKVLGVVSTKYKIVQNREAFSFIDDLLENEVAPVTFESAGALNGGKLIWILAHLPSRTILGDEIIPYLVFANSHDGTKAVTAAMTPTRVVCQNTLTIALKNAERSWSIRHMGDIQGKRDDAARTLRLSVSYMDKMEAKAEEYQQKKLTDSALLDVLNIIFPVEKAETNRQKGNILDQKEQFLNVYARALRDDLAKFKGDCWGLYNGFADYASHIKPTRETQNFRENNFAGFIDGNKMLAKVQNAIETVCA